MLLASQVKHPRRLSLLLPLKPPLKRLSKEEAEISSNGVIRDIPRLF